MSSGVIGWVLRMVISQYLPLVRGSWDEPAM
jgi:hypothetical protein